MNGSVAALTPILKRCSSALQVTPLSVVLLLFLVGPVIVILIFSFYIFNGFFMEPGFVTDNYEGIFTSFNTLEAYLATFKIAAITWAITLVFGFILSYYFVFDIIAFRWKIFLFLLSVVPFWTSGVVRMISWIPFLGKEGLLNRALQGIGVIDEPLEFLLFSEFAVIVSYVHMYTLFMVAPLFNVMAKIDRSLIEAARDSGASAIQIFFNIIVPLCKPGIAIGTIFVVALVMGDFVSIRVLSGGQAGTVLMSMRNQVDVLQYPFACASAVLLLIVLLMIVGGIMSVVDVRKQL
ncbi:MAG: ABC transporter permease [Rhodospirillales bacterium]|nr:ABC transporter permease [Rhodospirillales bacterium]MDE0391452.1 ABC transporter permease [Rhodospirillales bacterium]